MANERRAISLIPQVHVLDIVHLAAEEARCQAFELVGGVGDIEAEGAMLGGGRYLQL